MQIGETRSVCANSGWVEPVNTNLVPGPVNTNLGPGPGPGAGKYKYPGNFNVTTYKYNLISLLIWTNY